LRKGVDLSQLGDQIGSLTCTLAQRILERVREFKSTFSAWPQNTPAKPRSEKVYHRQPGTAARAGGLKMKKKTANAKKSTPAKHNSKKTSSKGRTRRRK